MGQRVYRYVCNHRGVTLLELIISLAILGIILVPLSSFFTQAMHNSAIARDKLIASQLAQQYMEKYKATLVSAKDKMMPIKDTVGQFIVNTTITPQNDYPNQQEGGYTNDNADAVMTIQKASDPIKNIVQIANDDTDAAAPDVKNQVIYLDDTNSINLLIDDHLNINGSHFTYTLENNIINIVVLIDADFSTVVNINNTLSTKQDTICNVYIVKKVGKLGQVQVHNQGGSVRVFDNLYENIPAAAFVDYRLYKMTVIVYKDSTPLITLESMKKVE